MSKRLRAFSRSLPMALLRTREAVMRRFRPVLRAHGVSEQQWRVLRALDDGGPLEAGALARRAVILPASLSRILKDLETRGLVGRRGVAGDRRRAVIGVRPKGRALIASVAPHSEARYAEIARKVGAERLESLYRILAEAEAALAAR